MNYRVQLVIGEDAVFFLEGWEPGGFVISEEAVGLFHSGPRSAARLEERLAPYRLRRATLDLTGLLKVGFSREWTWTSLRWAGEQGAPALHEVVRRIEAALGPGLHQDDERKVTLLRLVQHAVKRHGPPAMVEGEIVRAHGRKDRIAVHRTGVVAYDRTPHPLALLREVARAAGGV